MRLRLVASGLVLVGLGTFAACSLNPQPIPPNDEETSGGDRGNDGFGEPNQPPTAGFQDAGAAAQDGGDAGADADSGADAAPDADGGKS